ncbi:89d2fad3-61dd-4d5a-b52f-7161db358800-CDS [Sclerotinia trifoliorum]|uniref:89d2fad3-61dd-4d5a-b52f-7161db358800-CDS n=1 Tax=Sclerotinia trifoliorum TaxID=28548 RepID=A0A8H2VY84_9HELO|nr:89d2fad3-61dd-4d5a-b52f-7161db358800-CDS [Sclerotinia trifoliorum]
MDQAWLDSLSEDWVSQPRSESPEPELPSLTNGTSDSSNPRPTVLPSRIPNFNTETKSWSNVPDSNPLSERSQNEINIPLSQRTHQPSKLRSEIPLSPVGRKASRPLSASSTHTTEYNTVQHNKSVSASPKKSSKDTPEWKRRLLQGDVGYGEQRDLFSAAGLETIFQPPPTENSIKKLPAYGESSIMPSSPPLYRTRLEPPQFDDSELSSEDSVPEDGHGLPRGVRYKLTEDFGSEFSTNDLSRGSDFRPTALNTLSPVKEHFSPSNSAFDTDCHPTKNEYLDVGRTTSRQSDKRNEFLSPILLASQGIKGGKAQNSPLDISPVELQERLEKLRTDDPNVDETQDLENASRPITGDVTTDTDDLRRNGEFVKVRRGGSSEEGSFQKRMLSPSSLPPIDESALSLDDSRHDSSEKQLPKIRKTRASNELLEPPVNLQSHSTASTPHPSPAKSPVKSSFGSPLKLFGTHDTFTSQKLLRRLSQYEDRGSDSEPEVPPNTAHETAHHHMDTANEKRPVSEGSHFLKERKSRRFSSFGVGDLDSFRFNEDVSFESNGSILHNDDVEDLAFPVLDPRSQTRFRFRLDSSPNIKEEVDRQTSGKYRSTSNSSSRRSLSVRKRSSTGSFTPSSVLPSFQMTENLKTPRRSNGEAEGKRLLRSPLKDPTPKRRRTLHRADISLPLQTEDPRVSIDGLPRPSTQPAMGKTRQDNERRFQAAEPKILAMRELLRPRTPTPSQRNGQQREEALFVESELASDARTRILQEQKIAMVQAELDLANSDMPLGASQQSQDSRKPSVTTQDFLDEAKKIMAGIRGKARPRSGFTSLEESESEGDQVLPSNISADDEIEDSYQESTQELFERPPSREGAPVSRAPLTQDPELLDHLRKYEENSEMDGIIASSIKSMAMAKEAIRNAREIDRIADETISKSLRHFLDPIDTVQSDPPNIRISNNPDIQRKRKHSDSSRQLDEEYDDPDFFTHGSNNSIPTTSSRGSDSRRVIAPHTVSHLIPEQLAGMVFDRERNMWVKRKSTRGERDGQDSPNSEGTEEDPFEDIPDLSFDETQELMRLRAVAAKQKEDARLRLAKYLDDEKQHDELTGRSPTQNNLNMSVSPVDMRPQTAPSKPVHLGLDNSVPEIKIRSASTGEDSVLRPKKTRNGNANKLFHGSHSSSVSKPPHESRKLADGDIFLQPDGDPSTTTPKRQRNVTITFSSPIAELIEIPTYIDDDSSTKEEPYQSDYDSVNESDSDDGGSIGVKKGKSGQGNGTHEHRNTSRQLSVGGQQFMPRPVSRIDEQDEDSLDRGSGSARKHGNNLLPTPSASPRRTDSVVLATPRPAHEIGTLELTPLSEFTMHQADESYGLNVSYVANGQKHIPGASTKKTLSHSIKAMVEKLTEIEPYEPFWEHMKRADLHRKKLTNLHKLNEFCEHLEELKVSKNEISQLNGVPSSLRTLIISHNRLSDLTSWGHLWNLQQVDVSNNEIESLSCFKSLIHLRTLQADNNQITSLHGIEALDGLITLRLRGNPIETLNFEGTNLKHLERLDLRDCQISEVKNLSQLPKLSSLDLENNKLYNFMTSDDSCSAREVRLSFNNLESFDASLTPEIRILYLDANRIKTITGLLHKRNLYSLSVRKQQSGTVLDKSFLQDAYEVRKLFLSGNYLGTFHPGVEYLNLQYLELANCGITSLPDDFGLMVANVRVLNLNFNGLQEFQCLLGIVRLKKLLLAGNRLSKVERLTRTLRAFPYLTTVDMRNNHVNHNFYPVALERCLVKDGGLEKTELDVIDPYSLGNADPVRDAHYISCSDMGTKAMRRVYEMLIFGKRSDNPKLHKLDGLPVNREVSKIRDDVWDRLLEIGYVKETEKSNEKTNHGQTENEKAEEVLEEPKGAHQETRNKDSIEEKVAEKGGDRQKHQSDIKEGHRVAQGSQAIGSTGKNVEKIEREAEAPHAGSFGDKTSGTKIDPNSVAPKNGNELPADDDVVQGNTDNRSQSGQASNTPKHRAPFPRENSNVVAAEVESASPASMMRRHKLARNVERIIAKSEATVAKHRALVKRMNEEARENVSTHPESKRVESNENMIGFPPQVIPLASQAIYEQSSQNIGANFPTAAQLKQDFEEMLQSFERDSKPKGSRTLHRNRDEYGASVRQSSRNKPATTRGVKKVEFAEGSKEAKVGREPRWPAEDSFA